MADKKFEIFIEDVGDPSVGLQAEHTFKAELCENMVNYLKEEKLLDKFEEKLEALVNEFFEAETYYKTFDTLELEAERKYYEEMESKYE